MSCCPLSADIEEGRGKEVLRYSHGFAAKPQGFVRLLIGSASLSPTIDIKGVAWNATNDVTESEDAVHCCIASCSIMTTHKFQWNRGFTISTSNRTMHMP